MIKRRRGHPYVYPWEKWFDGNEHILTQGVHFKTTPESFRVGAYQVAKNWKDKYGRKMKVSVSINRGSSKRAQIVLQSQLLSKSRSN